MRNGKKFEDTKFNTNTMQPFPGVGGCRVNLPLDVSLAFSLLVIRIGGGGDDPKSAPRENFTLEWNGVVRPVATCFCYIIYFSRWKGAGLHYQVFQSFPS